MQSEFLSKINDNNLVDFGHDAGGVNEILQDGVFLYRQDKRAAEARFRAALAADPSALAAYLCLYKICCYQGRLDEALAAAHAGIREAARQAGLDTDWSLWQRKDFEANPGAPAHFALYTLKALAFIHLRRREPTEAARCLDQLTELGELTAVGGSVVADLARGLVS